MLTAITRFLHLTFYIIFNSYYKNGNYKNDHPRFTVMFIFAIVVAAQLLSLYTIIDTVFDLYYTSPLNRAYSGLGMILSIFLSYFLFLKGGKEMEIYRQFRDKKWANTKIIKIAGWLYVFLSILSPFILAIARNAVLGRHLI